MSDLLKTLGANRRDCVWFFILSSLSLGYTLILGTSGQFLFDSMPPSLTRHITIATIEVLAVASGLVGIVLALCGLSVLVAGGSSEL